MQTDVMSWFDMEAPIFAFTHCPDVAAAVSANGGFGALGTTRTTVDQFAIDLKWLVEHSPNRPFGVDVMFPSKAPKEFEEMTPAQIRALIPKEHEEFLDHLTAEHGLPVSTAEEKEQWVEDYVTKRLRTHAEAGKRLELVYEHPMAQMIISALGVPPQQYIDRAHECGMKVASLVGHPKHVQRQIDAGVDILIAAGYEAGGHTGDIASFVLTPQVVDAAGDIPVLHAGGIARGRQIAAAMALGAQAVWTGSIWLGTSEAETTPVVKDILFEASSGDTMRSTSGSGKPVRRVKGGFIQAWETEGAPRPLPMPLQSVLVEELFSKMDKYQTKSLLSPPAGQTIGMMSGETDVRGVIYDLMVEFGETMAHLEDLFETGG